MSNIFAIILIIICPFENLDRGTIEKDNNHSFNI